ncbi:guanine nucleotide exchange protein for ADP-robosylation factor [Cladochytrium tenue]|nr:guanine nucleotide exchange protein for ADP-robosylation factor [Cladochytrium tenue]
MKGLNKVMIGEFLGEGDEENIAIMHAFVDEFDFSGMHFVPALRSFLQSFRLPGEAQKIDRFMLKFAQRYVQGNPTSFSTADTAYVLAYSVIMLNTDQHNPQVKKRMTEADFVKNNRKDASQYAMVSENMAMKTEAIFQTIIKTGRRGQSGSGAPSPQSTSGMPASFVVASHFEHVKPMFQMSWMNIVAALSVVIHETDDQDVATLALEGFKHCVKIAALFDLEEERKSIISTLSGFTHVPNLLDVKLKHVYGIKSLVEIALASSDHIGDSWMDIVLAVSQLEKIQQLGAELLNNRQSRTVSANGKPVKMINEEAASLASSQAMTLAVDRLFTSSSTLSGKAIVEFVQALCTVSWDEITSSATASEHPRMYCLQRLVEISYYNMRRIRVEWSNLWSILGDHFNQVGCYDNTQVCFFALDKLRQLAIKFLDLEELPSFKFQKDFLRPFAHILAVNPDPKIKDMALACLLQMIQTKPKSIKSGWRTMFGALGKAARENHVLFGFFEVVTTCDLEVRTRALTYLFDALKLPDSIHSVESWEIVLEGVVLPIFDPLLVQAEDTYRGTYSKEDLGVWMSTTLVQALRQCVDLFAQHFSALSFGVDRLLELLAICMTQDNETLARIGSTCMTQFVENNVEHLDDELWNKICNVFTHLFKFTTPTGLFFDYREQAPQAPPAVVAPPETDGSGSLPGKEASSAGALGIAIPGFAGEPPDINYTSLVGVQVTSLPAAVSRSATDISGRGRPAKKDFPGIIFKCVLHLIVLQTVQDILCSDSAAALAAQRSLGPDNAFRLLDCLERSYRFAHAFNLDTDLRAALFRLGFMKQLPNLLKQETSSVAVYVAALMKLYAVDGEDRRLFRSDIEARLLPEILDDYNASDPDATKRRNAASWRPVVAAVLAAFAGLADDSFRTHAPSFYNDFVDLLRQDLTPDLRAALHSILTRIGALLLRGVTPQPPPPSAPTKPELVPPLPPLAAGY